MFAIISPLIFVALLGFICTKTKWLSQDQLNALSKFTFSISIPAFLFYQMSKANFSEQISPQLFAAFYLPVLICYFIAWLISYYFYRDKHHLSNTNNPTTENKNSATSAVFALGSSYSNTVIVGLPVLLAALGDQVIGIVFLIVTFHSAMLFSLTSAIVAQSNAKNSDQKSNLFTFIIQTFNNPLILSILSGLLVNLLGIDLPDFLQNSLALISKPAISLALFVLGASLAFYPVKSKLKFISIACLIKLILLPTLVFITANYIFNLEPFIITVLVILSACPTGVNAYLIAITHQHHQETVAGTVVISTLLSIVTVPLWLSFMLL